MSRPPNGGPQVGAVAKKKQKKKGYIPVLKGALERKVGVTIWN